MTAETTRPSSLPASIRFGHLDICFDDRVLAPRPWTARQAEWAAELLADLPEGPVLELCSGAGQIGLLAIALVPRRLVCVDLDPAACAFVRTNAERAGLTDLVDVREGTIEDAVTAGERFAMVIADPPWVPSQQVARFPADPVLAIDGGADGMVVAGHCLTAAERHLMPGGSAVLQLGTASQACRATEVLSGSDLEVLEVRESPGEGVLIHIERPTTSVERVS